MEADNKVLNKIRKLMAIANGNAQGGEHERDTAMKMAYKLLAAHNLSMGDLETPMEERIKEQEAYHSTPWMRTCAAAICQLYFCKMFYSRSSSSSRVTYTFIGLASNVATAREMLKYVTESIEKEGKRYWLAHPGSPSIATDFRYGAAAKVHERCRQLRAEAEAEQQQQSSTGTALVLASLYRTELQANEAFLANLGINLKSSKSRNVARNHTAYGAGQAYGASVGLTRQVGGSNSALKRLG